MGAWMDHGWMNKLMNERIDDCTVISWAKWFPNGYHVQMNFTIHNTKNWNINNSLIGGYYSLPFHLSMVRMSTVLPIVTVNKHLMPREFNNSYLLSIASSASRFIAIRTFLPLETTFWKHVPLSSLFRRWER